MAGVIVTVSVWRAAKPLRPREFALVAAPAHQSRQESNSTRPYQLLSAMLSLAVSPPGCALKRGARMARMNLAASTLSSRSRHMPNRRSSANAAAESE
jgi:hypothetical protein